MSLSHLTTAGVHPAATTFRRLECILPPSRIQLPDDHRELPQQTRIRSHLGPPPKPDPLPTSHRRRREERHSQVA